jgi:hypothetical protein
MSHTETEPDAEFVVGVPALRAELKRLTGQDWSGRRAYWLIESGVLRVGKLGGRILASRSAIRTVFEKASTGSVDTRERIAAARAMSADLPERAANDLLCAICRRPFERPSRPGRPPKRCPACRAAQQR